MKKDWFARLKEAIASDPRSLRKLSEAANKGPNFVQQMLKNEKEPGVDNLAAVLDALGDEASLYVLTGAHISQRDLEFLQLFKSLPAEAQENALHFFASLASRSENASPPPAAPPPSGTKA
ncbi:hypothetical protein FGG78_20170 [Thioclava sp. BHET1]|nr:hypothetical protein FGG78_20170 [Thioclava sp. BHET1]